MKDKNARIKASKGALKVIYYVIIGIAITQSLDQFLLKNGSFVGAGLFSMEHLQPFLLLLVFLPTICRFVHGASMHLDDTGTPTSKPLLDFVGFFLQATLFYIMALSISDGAMFALAFGLMLLVDASWLVVLWGIGHMGTFDTDKQWLASDACLLVVLLGLWLFGPPMSSWVSAGIILIASSIATIADYRMNRDFYFPKAEPLGP